MHSSPMLSSASAPLACLRCGSPAKVSATQRVVRLDRVTPFCYSNCSTRLLNALAHSASAHSASAHSAIAHSAPAHSALAYIESFGAWANAEGIGHRRGGRKHIGADHRKSTVPAFRSTCEPLDQPTLGAWQKRAEVCAYRLDDARARSGLADALFPLRASPGYHHSQVKLPPVASMSPMLARVKVAATRKRLCVQSSGAALETVYSYFKET
jgi:hypothetical protein